MAGVRELVPGTYIVKDASGVTAKTFVMGVADSAGLKTNIKNVTGANVKCIGVVGSDGDNTDIVDVQDKPGTVTRVTGDGTCVCNDMVTNDANGLATPIAATGTPTLYYVHGVVLGRDKSGSGQILEIMWSNTTIYM